MKQGISAPKPPLRWTAVLFAFAANMLLVTLANNVVQALQWPTEFEVLATLVAPLTAGVLTALYASVRGGMHAFLGGLLSMLPLLLFTFGGVWQLAVFAACFCTLGGALTEIILRRTSRQGR
jgi:hypothetical protein